MSGLSKVWKPVSGAIAATALTVSAAAAEQCGNDVSYTWDAKDATISANGASATDSHITLSRMNGGGNLVILGRTVEGHLAYHTGNEQWVGTNEYYEGPRALGQLGAGSAKIYDGSDARGPDGILIDPTRLDSFDEATFKFTDVLASRVKPEHSPTDHGNGNWFSLTATFADGGSVTERYAIPAPNRYDVSIVKVEFPDAVSHVAFQPGVSSLGIQEVQLKDQRTACESDSDSKPAGGHTGTLGFDTGSEAYQQQVAFTRTLG